MADKEKKKKTKEKQGTPRERKPNWQEYTATVKDVEAFLADRVMLRRNVVTGRTEIHELSDIGRPTPEGYQPITDTQVNTLWKELAQEKKTDIQFLYRVINSDFVPAYHPFRHYLERLPRWNECDDYILELSESVSVRGDGDERLLFYVYLKKWLVGMVAAWVDDTVVNNVILVLIGRQGIYKTTWFQHLLPPELRQYFYTKTNSGRMTKDDLLKLSQYGLVCCEELDTMRPSELNQLKAAVTMTSIDERPPYGHFTEHRQHVASFCGTGNNVQFLSDPTGSRRWLPFEVESIRSPRDEPFFYEGIYAQAYALYRQGFRYWFSQDEVRLLSRRNQHFETPRLEVELVQQYFRQPEPGEQGEWLPVGIALQIVGAGITQKLSLVWLGRAFMQLGFEFAKSNGIRKYLVVRRSVDEIRQMRQQAPTGEDDPEQGGRAVRAEVF